MSNDDHPVEAVWPRLSVTVKRYSYSPAEKVLAGTVYEIVVELIVAAAVVEDGAPLSRYSNVPLTAVRFLSVKALDCTRLVENVIAVALLSRTPLAGDGVIKLGWTLLSSNVMSSCGGEEWREVPTDRYHIRAEYECIAQPCSSTCLADSSESAENWYTPAAPPGTLTNPEPGAKATLREVTLASSQSDVTPSTHTFFVAAVV